jgi:citrate lyase subunit beta/citryl-CoA lyase
MAKRKIAGRVKAKRKTGVKRKASAKRPGRGTARLKTADAGRKGDDVRSDIHVAISPQRSGGTKVQLSSRVEAFYGESIAKSVAAVLNAYAVKHARVKVVDTGALDWVIAARTEAALRRAGYEGDGRPPQTFKRKGASERDRLRRSRLYLPGNEPKFMLNAGVHRPDAVILDLEDSVHPDEKDAARLLVRNALRCHDFLGAERMVRINQLPLGFDDLDAVVPESPDVILIPKTETHEQVIAVDKRVQAIRKRARASGPVWLMPILESALGVENAFAIASAADTVVALTIGLEDYTADLGVRKSRDGSESAYARLRLVNAARAARVQAIDSVYGDVGDMEGLSEWGARARQMGFEGMGCIHPRQIRVIHDAFAPSQHEIDKALEIVAAFEAARRKGLGVVSLGTRMIDPPVVLRAQRLVATAKRAGLID